MVRVISLLKGNVVCSLLSIYSWFSTISNIITNRAACLNCKFMWHAFLIIKVKYKEKLHDYTKYTKIFINKFIKLIRNLLSNLRWFRYVNNRKFHLGEFIVAYLHWWMILFGRSQFAEVKHVKKSKNFAVNKYGRNIWTVLHYSYI